MKCLPGEGTIRGDHWRISPDGNRIAGKSRHVAQPNNIRHLQIFVGDAKTGTLREATKESHHIYNFFGWSPEGRKLLYQILDEPAPGVANGAYHQILAAIDADGRNRLEILDNECHYNAQGQRQAIDMIEWADWR